MYIGLYITYLTKNHVISRIHHHVASGAFVLSFGMWGGGGIADVIITPIFLSIGLGVLKF